MDCVACGSAAVTERPERTARGYRRFRCRECGKQYNERSGGLLNHTHYPSDVIALVVLWRLYRPRMMGHRVEAYAANAAG
jgi:putative transposase